MKNIHFSRQAWNRQADLHHCVTTRGRCFGSAPKISLCVSSTARVRIVRVPFPFFFRNSIRSSSGYDTTKHYYFGLDAVICFSVWQIIMTRHTKNRFIAPALELVLVPDQKSNLFSCFVSRVLAFNCKCKQKLHTKHHLSVAYLQCWPAPSITAMDGSLLCIVVSHSFRRRRGGGGR